MPMDFHRYQSVADGQEALLTESSALSNCLLGRWSIIPPGTVPNTREAHMRFASFVFPTSHHPENDSAVIDSTLEEILLAEEIGMHSVWLTEHHFDGAAAHADPRCWALPLPPGPNASGSASPWSSWPFTIPSGWRSDCTAGQPEPRSAHRGYRARLSLQPLRIPGFWYYHGRRYSPAG